MIQLDCKGLGRVGKKFTLGREFVPGEVQVERVGPVVVEGLEELAVVLG